jgi:tetrahydromethanopterin S-methyltransferase subunit G
MSPVNTVDTPRVTIKIPTWLLPFIVALVTVGGTYALNSIDNRMNKIEKQQDNLVPKAEFQEVVKRLDEKTERIDANVNKIDRNVMELVKRR